ncbi:uncharacterized protein [Miscanthus floridulus]|uniref:uncharacterized protein n=1 Tax=Miscanthus floridulus TaxID=154761 RepID=UPI00345A7F0D
MLLFYEVGDEYAFFEKVWRLLADDIQYQFRDMIGNQNYQMADNGIRNHLLDNLTALFAKSGSNICNFNLPHRTSAFASSSTNRLVEEELSYNIPCSSDQSDFQSALNDDQIAAFNSIVNRVTNEEPGFFFISGYGGTGKMFLWNCIVNHLRSQNKIVLTVASSGVASLLLPAGCIAHSRFKIPCDLDETSICDIKRGTMLAELIQITSLVIWDEALMTHRVAFEAVDRTFWDIQSQNCSEVAHLLFGGKVVVLGGDLRKILPVIEGGTQAQVINAAIVNSPLWSCVTVLSLTKNMRNENGPILHVDLIITDKEGGVMYAEIPRDEVQNKSPLIEAGKVYTISRFRVKNAKYSYMPICGNNMIEFTCYTRIIVEDIPSDVFPQFVYTLVPFSEIHQHVSVEPEPAHTPASSDVAECVIVPV